MEYISANHANLSAKTGAVDIQALGLTYLSLQYCNMYKDDTYKGTYSNQAMGGIWKIMGTDIPYAVMAMPGDSDTDIWSDWYNRYLYPESLELHLEGNGIRFHCWNGDNDNEDLGFWFRMGYVSSDSVIMFENSRSSSSGNRCGVKLRTEEQANNKSDDGFWNVSNNSIPSSRTMAQIGSPKQGEKYFIEFHSTDGGAFYEERSNHHYFYPFGK